MKAIVVAALVAAGIGLMGMTQAMTASAGGVIGQAANTALPITKARCALSRHELGQDCYIVRDADGQALALALVVMPAMTNPT